MTLPQFQIGNIILTPYKQVVIVTTCDKTKVHWISANSSNCSGGGHLEQQITLEECDCDPMRGFDVICEPKYNPDCKRCFGSGTAEKIIPGYNESILLANNMKEYIEKRVMGTMFPEMFK